MKTVIHKSLSRGHANHGWLNSYHTFSFAGYYNPERIHFGVLRVLNDDTVKGGRGFGTHPHENMEIVTIPLKGALEHKDSTGRHKIINQGEIQIMSAGSGIQHSEYNASKEKEINFLQIWILPDKRDIDPRYEQKEFSWYENINTLVNVVAPDNREALWINQQAWFYLGKFEKGQRQSVSLNNKKNGLYIFVIEGEIQVDDHSLQTRDAIGSFEIETGTVDIYFVEESEILVMEVAMT